MISQARRFGEALPEHLENPPKLHYGSGFFFQAFLDLCSTRNIGMDISGISWLSAEKYAERFGLSLDELADFWYLIAGMDNAYLKRVRSKNGKESKRSIDIIEEAKLQN